MDYSNLDKTYEALWEMQPFSLNESFRPWAKKAGELADKELMNNPDYKILTRKVRAKKRKKLYDSNMEILNEKYEGDYLKTRDTKYYE